MKTVMVSAEKAVVSQGLDELGNEVFSFHQHCFHKLTGPGVYAAMRGSGESLEVLYIGSAKNLLARISDPEHESLKKAFSFPDCRMLITTCRSEQHARELEALLIAENQPNFNITGKSPNSDVAKAIRGE